MSKIHLLTTIAKLATKNIGLAVGDSLTFGMVGAVKDTALEIVESTTATNEALYYMQVRTFLETANLNEEEVTDFFKNNTDHQRLGVEIFKILEQTYIEQQSKMMARSFRLLALGEIDRKTYDKLIYIITNLNQYLINRINEYSPDDQILSKKFDLNYSALGGGELFRNNNDYTQEEKAYERKINMFFYRTEVNVPQELINFGFYKPQEIALTLDLEKIPQQEYAPTRFFLWFMTNILRDND